MTAIRKRVLTHFVHGNSPTDTAKRLSIIRMTVYKIKKSHEETEGTSKRPSPRRPRSLLTAEIIEAIKKSIRANPGNSIQKLTKGPQDGTEDQEGHDQEAPRSPVFCPRFSN